MNQTEQAEHITPLEAAAKAIFSLQRQVAEYARSGTIDTIHIAEHAERIVELERQIALQHGRIERLETAFSHDAGASKIAITLIRQAERIEKLEAALSKVMRRYVPAPSTY